MMENNCHSKIILWSYYEKHVGDHDHSRVEHVRKFPKIRISSSGYYWKSVRIDESFYQRIYRCFYSVMRVTLMAQVLLSNPRSRYYGLIIFIILQF